MSDEVEKFSPDDANRRGNPIGRILVTLLTLVASSALIYKVYTYYQTFLVPLIIILVTGFIIISLWHKDFYIYRYMLPAIIIILVFTAYPIFYTIFIAFTNFGTGHIQDKSEAQKILLTSNWTLENGKEPLYAEFYGPKKEISKYIENYKKQYEDFDYKMSLKRKAGKSEDAIDELWEKDFYGKIQPSLIKNNLGNLKKSDFVILLYTHKNVYMNQINAETNEVMDDQTKTDSETDTESEDENSRIPLKVFVSQNGNNLLNEINIKDVDQYTIDMILLGESVYKLNEDEERPGLDKAERDIDSENTIMVSFSDMKTIYDGFKDKYPLILEGAEYLIEQSNQFMSKRHTFKIENNQMKMINQDDYTYDRTVFEENKYGKFVVTNDGKLPVFWKEYKISDLISYDYGPLTLEKSANIEDFIQAKLDGMNFISQIEIPSQDQIENIPLKEMNDEQKAALQEVKKQIQAANQKIIEFNKTIPSLRDEYIKMKIDEINNYIPPLPETIEKSIMENRIISKLKDNDEVKFLLYYYRVPLTGNISYNLEVDRLSDDKIVAEIWKILNSVKYKDITKEKIRQINEVKSAKFPRLGLIKLEQIENSNIDYEVTIEPGYSVIVGFNNFIKIFSSRNITAPFFFVFIWTVIWSAVSVLTSFAMGLGLALVFNSSDFKGKYIYRTLFILPYAIPSFVTILMWSGFLNKDFGVINMLFNLDVPWLMNGYMAKISTLIVNLWLSFPYFMIISLGALQSIDSSMYEAADVDGANSFQQFRLITLPLLLLALGPMLVGSFAFAFNNFGGIYLLTGGGPTMAAGVLPGHTDILISYTYKLAFGEQNKDYGLASAIAIIVFLIIGTLTFVNFKLTGTFKEVDNA